MTRPIVRVKIKQIAGWAPMRMTEGAAGFDIFAVDDFSLHDGYVETVSCGFALELPRGYEAQLRSRSGLSKKGVTVANAPATIDSDYRGLVSVLLRYDPPAHSPRVYTFKKSERVAQMVICELPEIELVSVDELSETVRGDKGFGSTGQ